MTISKFGFALSGSLIAGTLAVGQPPPNSQEAVHKELRALRDGIIASFNKKDVDGLLKFVHPKAVVTWQDASVCRGHQQIRDYYQKMMTGEKRVVESVSATAEVDELTTLHGENNGVAVGSVDQHFVLTDGMDFHLPNRWTADIVKEGDRWLIASLHVSANLFNNPIQTIAVKKTALWVGIPCAVLGIVVGLLGGRLMSRRSVQRAH